MSNLSTPNLVLHLSSVFNLYNLLGKRRVCIQNSEFRDGVINKKIVGALAGDFDHLSGPPANMNVAPQMNLNFQNGGESLPFCTVLRCFLGKASKFQERSTPR